jgi:hypothetical protein
MNPSDSHEGGFGINAALLTALTTEHYSLQSSRSGTIAEANGRSQLFLSAVSGAIVALALVAQMDRLGETFTVFALSVLPALLALGLTSYARRADLAVHDAYYARAIGRIRAFYWTIEPGATQYWMQPAGDDPHALMRQHGQAHSRWHHLSHAATSVAAVNGILAGVLVGFGLSVVTPIPALLLASISAAVTIGLFSGLFVDQERRWRRSDELQPTRFLPDGTPAMTVHTIAPGPLAPRGHTATYDQGMEQPGNFAGATQATRP